LRELASFQLVATKNGAGRMHRRRIARTLGAAAGGLLGTALLPVALAFADDYEYVPVAPETVTGLYGLDTASPAVDNSIQGYQLFDVEDTTTGKTVGSFEADVSNDADGFGGSNQELLVTSDVSGTAGTAAGDVPTVGSVIDTYDSPEIGLANVYSALAGSTPSTDVISDTEVTSLGDYAIPTSFDAVAHEQPTDIPLADGDTIVPASPDEFTGISGVPPYAVAAQGDELFDVKNAEGAVIGTFDADVTTTSDGAGNYTEALLVTKDVTGSPGTTAADVPSVGSVLTTYTPSGSGYEDVYSDLAGTTPAISDYYITPFGDFSEPETFNAASTEEATAITLGDGYQIVPAGTETLTGINGLPPTDLAIQGYQLFDVENAAGTVVGSFDADVSSTSGTPTYGASTESLLVTSDGPGTVGTGAGDIPPVGSVIETTNYFDSGFGNIYTDLASTTAGGDVISDTVVTPFGDFAIPSTLDAAVNLANETFASF
jgi:hypothetical protein